MTEGTELVDFHVHKVAYTLSIFIPYVQVVPSIRGRTFSISHLVDVDGEDELVEVEKIDLVHSMAINNTAG